MDIFLANWKIKLRVQMDCYNYVKCQCCSVFVKYHYTIFINNNNNKIIIIIIETKLDKHTTVLLFD